MEKSILPSQEFENTLNKENGNSIHIYTLHTLRININNLFWIDIMKLIKSKGMPRTRVSLTAKAQLLGWQKQRIFQLRRLIHNCDL